MLVNARGTLTRPVSNLRFDGLRFEYATWLGVSGPQGYADDQTGFHVTGSNQPQTFEHAQYTTRTPGNLRFAYARDVSIVDCTFRHLGAVAVDFNTGSQHDTIADSSFSDISAAAIQLGGVDPVDMHPTRPGQVTRDNLIANNTITKAAQEFFDAAAIFVGYTTRTTIIHNTLSNLPYTGISIGWGWGMTDPTASRAAPDARSRAGRSTPRRPPARATRSSTTRSPNYLQLLYDGGGIYSLGQQGTSLANGELIAGNVIFGKAPTHGGNALYTDGGSRYITLRGNAAFNNPTGIDGPGGSPYGHDWGGCRPYGDIVWAGNWWQNPGTTYDCTAGYPPVNVSFSANTADPGPRRRTRRRHGPGRRALTRRQRTRHGCGARSRRRR